MANNELSLILRMNIQEFLRTMVEAQKNLDDMGKGAKKSGDDLKHAFNLLDLRPSRSIEREIQQMEAAYNRLARSGKISTQDLARAHEALERQTTKLKHELNNTQQPAHNLGNTFSHVAKNAALFGAAYLSISAIGNAIKELIVLGAEFTQTMANVAAVMGISKASQEFKELNLRAREMGATTQFTASQAAEGLEILASQGFNAKQAIAAIDPALKMAIAGNISIAEASELAAGSMHGFKLQIEDLMRIGNVYAITSNTSAANFEKIREASKYASGSFQTLGWSIEEMSAAIGKLSNVNMDASTIGISLRMMAARLATEPTVAGRALAELGLKVTDANGKFKSFSVFMEELSSKISVLSQGEQVKKLTHIFGVEASSAAMELVKQSAPLIDQYGNKLPTAFQQYVTQLENSKTALYTIASVRADTLTGDWKIFISTVQEVGLQIFELAENPLRNFVQMMSRVALASPKIFEDFISPLMMFAGGVLSATAEVASFLIQNRELVMIFGGLILAIKSATVAMAIMESLKVGGMLGTLAGNATLAALSLRGLSLIQMATWFTAGATGATAFATALGRISVILAAGFAVVEVAKLSKSLFDLYQIRKLTNEAETEAGEIQANANTKLSQLSNKIGLAIPNMKTFNAMVKDGAIAFNEQTQSWEKATGTAEAEANKIKQLEGEISDKEKQLANEIRNQMLEERTNARNAVTDMLEGRLKMDVSILQSAQYTKREILKIEKQANNEIRKLQKELEESQMSTQDKIRELKRKEMDDDEKDADIKLQIQEKLKASREAFQVGDVSKATKLGADAESLAGQIEDVNAAIKVLEESAKIKEDSIKKNIAQVTEFRDALQKNTFAGVEVEIDTKKAEEEIVALKKQLAELKDKSITVTVHQQNVQAKSGGGVISEALHFSTGSVVPGTGNSDTVPAMLTPQEFVVRKERSIKFRDLLNLINYGNEAQVNSIWQTVPKMATGGVVRFTPYVPTFANGGTVPTFSSSPLETIRLEWSIGKRNGTVDTLMSQRKALKDLVSAVDEVMRGI